MVSLCELDSGWTRTVCTGRSTEASASSNSGQGACVCVVVVVGGLPRDD